MAQPDGRIEQGQSIKSAFSASKWNDLCNAADVVHGRTPGTTGRAASDRQHLLCVTSSAWAKGTSQTLNVYSGPQGAEQQVSDQITAFNKFTDIDANKSVIVARIGAAWYVISAEC